MFSPTVGRPSPGSAHDVAPVQGFATVPESGPGFVVSPGLQLTEPPPLAASKKISPTLGTSGMNSGECCIRICVEVVFGGGGCRSPSCNNEYVLLTRSWFWMNPAHLIGSPTAVTALQPLATPTPNVGSAAPARPPPYVPNN